MTILLNSFTTLETAKPTHSPYSINQPGNMPGISHSRFQIPDRPHSGINRPQKNVSRNIMLICASYDTLRYDFNLFRKVFFISLQRCSPAVSRRTTSKSKFPALQSRTTISLHSSGSLIAINPWDSFFSKCVWNTYKLCGK